MANAETSLGHTPGHKWEFDESVTSCFGDMLERSIPDYAVMRKAVTDIAIRFAKDRTTILDLGTSTGLALDDIVRQLGVRCNYVGLEISKPMLQAARERFEGAQRSGYVKIEEWDLRKSFPLFTTSVVLSILTLQFIPINYRQGIVQKAYDAMAPGGAFILVEKVLGNSTVIDDLQVDLYHRMKGERGYSGEEIERKRTALEGVLVPVKASWNEELLRNAGFRQVDCFWRWMNFAGWVAVK